MLLLLAFAHSGAIMWPRRRSRHKINNSITFPAVRIVTSQVVSITDFDRRVVRLAPGSEVQVEVTVFPMMIIVPRTQGLELTVCTSTGDPFGRFNESRRDFAVYFNDTRGIVRIRALYETTAEFFAMPAEPQCQSIYVSTSASERFIGSGRHANYSGANFTLDKNQHFCFCHVSDSATRITVHYKTDNDSNMVCLRSRVHGSLLCYGGIGEFSLARSYHTEVEWRSSRSSNQDGGFAIALESPTSTLPAFRGQANVASGRPLIIGDPFWPLPTSSPSPTRSFSPENRTILLLYGPSRDSLRVGSGSVTEFVVDRAPMVVTFPRTDDLSTVIADRLNAPSDFALFLPNATSTVLVKALRDTVLEVYAVPSSPKCSRVWISTSPSERFEIGRASCRERVSS
jgi:hypothetical protein